MWVKMHAYEESVKKIKRAHSHCWPESSYSLTTSQPPFSSRFRILLMGCTLNIGLGVDWKRAQRHRLTTHCFIAIAAEWKRATGRQSPAFSGCCDGDEAAAPCSDVNKISTSPPFPLCARPIRQWDKESRRNANSVHATAVGAFVYTPGGTSCDFLDVQLRQGCATPRG